MAEFVPLQALVHAMASAVTEAQQEVEKAHVANIFNYLDREQRPLTMQFRVPSLRPEASPGEEDYYQAPLLALIPPNAMRIKQLEISFDIQLGNLAAASAVKTRSDATASPKTADALAAKLKRSLSVNPAVSAAVQRQGTAAHVVLTIEGVEPSEATSRLVMEMIKTQGVTGPAAKESKS